ncbi:MAG: DUF1700 domain-containing protein [Acholeplasmataceae bacterium]|jgi:hypothetical protein|nr:DUF1700 domain-containing protein [Acholeplasmataceae bacterium]
MKAKYLNELKEVLIEYRASNKDLNDILSDYDQLYEDALASGKTDDEVWQMLGTPREAANELIDTLQRRKEKNIKTKIIAVMPFISLIVFFVLGFYQDLWHPGWLVFLAIPMSAILLQARLKDGIVALMPFLSVIIFLILGWGYDLWNPGWMVFLSIPVVAILLHTNVKELPVAISPFVAVIAFMILGFEYNLWNPGWLVFLIIPMLGILHEKNLLKVFVYELSFALAIGFYLYMGYVEGSWGYGAIGFLLPVAMGLIFGDVKFMVGNFSEEERKKAITMVGIIVVAIGLFLALGFGLGGWAWAWQVFLLIPVVAIILFDKVRLTALMPFLAVIIFFSVGYFFDMFHISWLAFLLIPITAIIENA